MPPADADFSFRIVFERSVGNPRRIFDAASELIDGFEELDEAVTGSVDSKIKPVMVLEDIEAGSLRVFLKTMLSKVDDRGLKEGEWKKAIGPALVEAKYAAMAYLDKDKDGAADGVGVLRETLRELATSTDVRHLPDYAPIHEAKLIAALGTIQDAKRILGPKDKLMIETPEKVYEVDLGQTWEPSDVIPLDKNTTEKHSEGEIILTIRKPDMTGESMWQFTRGRFPVSAKITDERWLGLFHSGRVPLYSGDAMRCAVKFIYYFDEGGTMVDEKIEITKVLEIIHGSGGEQVPLFEQ